MRDDAIRVADMLRAIEQIRTYTSGGESEFFRDQKTADAVAYELLKLGEAAGQISIGLRSAHPDVPWSLLVRRRNQMVHEYFRISGATLWAFVIDDLDRLERSLRRVIPSARGTEDSNSKERR
ncbi:MAG: DUF86 domain-containing protein [Thermoplasmata archaeon]|nr:DUF86 domain-containing protein [Thermoplasmata archaeon]